MTKRLTVWLSAAGHLSAIVCPPGKGIEEEGTPLLGSMYLIICLLLLQLVQYALFVPIACSAHP